MKKIALRTDGRTYNQMRPLSVLYTVFPHATGSTMFSLGNTKVLSSVVMQQGVPSFLKGKKVGWLTGSYAMLPASTPVRMMRDGIESTKNSRAVEISRLIGRTFRSIVNLAALGERTIFIDCDVLSADGGTRVAAISGAYLALKAAQNKWLLDGIIQEPLLTEELAAVSVGICKEAAFLDITCKEDNLVDADFNFVVTRSEKIIEIQGGAERSPLSWSLFESARVLALEGANTLFSFFDRNIL